LQFGRFIIVGGFTTASHYAILLGLTSYARVQPVVASSIGFILSATVSYTINRRFTFRSDVYYFAGLQRFALIAATGLALNALALTAGMDLARMNYIAAQVGATGVVLLWNFHANRLWTFSGSPAASRASEAEAPHTGMV
jgi:putative flippase GtrA